MSDTLLSTKSGDSGAAKSFDPEVFSANLARALESSGRALSAYLKPRANGDEKGRPPGELNELDKTFTSVAEYWLSDKDRAASVQAKLGKAYLDLMTSAARRLSGEATTRAADPSPRDKRFQDTEWRPISFLIL